MVNIKKPLMRIFCYIPTPRIWKSSIVARFLDINIEIRGTKPPEINNWLWDFDARPLTEEDKIKLADKTSQGRTGFSIKLYKTDCFLKAHPLVVHPAAIFPFASIAIMAIVS